MNKDLTDLLTEFDEMGYIPTTFTENAEQAAIDWKNRLVAAIEAENAALHARLDKAIEIPFKVIDKLTGDEADIYNIALNEKWASHLVYCDMEGFAVEQDGSLVLLDECDHMAYPSADRFEIISEKRLAELKGQK